MIHACAISIVRAVGVTKTVSQPYVFQSNKPYQLPHMKASNTNEIVAQVCIDFKHEINSGTSFHILPVLREDLQNLQCFGCEETEYGHLH